MKYDQVIIVEDDLEVAPDFYQFFESTLPILKADPTLWCVSAWNDNGKKDLVDSRTPELLYRTDFFGGLGWMMTKELWINEIGPKWPKSVIYNCTTVQFQFMIFYNYDFLYVVMIFYNYDL